MASRGFAAGLKADVARKLPYYRSDFSDGLSAKSLASVLFIFFACFAPSVAFDAIGGPAASNEANCELGKITAVQNRRALDVRVGGRNGTRARER